MVASRGEFYPNREPSTRLARVAVLLRVLVEPAAVLGQPSHQTERVVVQTDRVNLGSLVGLEEELLGSDGVAALLIGHDGVLHRDIHGLAEEHGTGRVFPGTLLDVLEEVTEGTAEEGPDPRCG